MNDNSETAKCVTLLVSEWMPGVPTRISVLHQILGFVNADNNPKKKKQKKKKTRATLGSIRVVTAGSGNLLLDFPFTGKTKIGELRKAVENELMEHETFRLFVGRQLDVEIPQKFDKEKVRKLDLSKTALSNKAKANTESKNGIPQHDVSAVIFANEVPVLRLFPWSTKLGWSKQANIENCAGIEVNWISRVVSINLTYNDNLAGSIRSNVKCVRTRFGA